MNTKSFEKIIKQVNKEKTNKIIVLRNIKDSLVLSYLVEDEIKDVVIDRWYGMEDFYLSLSGKVITSLVSNLEETFKMEFSRDNILTIISGRSKTMLHEPETRQAWANGKNVTINKDVVKDAAETRFMIDHVYRGNVSYVHGVNRDYVIPKEINQEAETAVIEPEIIETAVIEPETTIINAVNNTSNETMILETITRDLETLQAKIQDCKLEIIGTWLWITGETYKNKETIKADGFRWSSKRAAWYKTYYH